MKYRDRMGNRIERTSGQDRLLALLYGTQPGRSLVKLLIQPPVSRLAGAVLNTRFSKVLIRPFVKRTGICLGEYEKQRVRDYASYNDFFCRKIRKERRPVNTAQDRLVSPCDGKVSVYRISADSSFRIKETRYTLEELLRSPRTAARYQGGYAYIFRLTVDDYHRYCYVEDGLKSPQRRIPGVFHTVNPVAGDRYPIYKENAREYCLIKTARAGVMVQMEVGALMVGTIRNYHADGRLVRRGEEKGRFEFGGSTVVVLVEPGAVIPDADLTANTAAGWETIVRLGEPVGEITGLPDWKED